VSWLRERLEDPNGGQVMSACIALALLTLLQFFVVVSMWQNYDRGQKLELSVLPVGVMSLTLSFRLIKYLRGRYAH
jgi:hypothetical protein